MNASLCKVEFVGGPSDGLVMNDPYFNIRHKLQLPACPATVRLGHTRCHELVGHWFTVYLLASRHCTIEDGHPTTCLRYDFSGYELQKTRAESDLSRRHTSRWLSRLCHWFSQLPRRFARWMVEPIDQPLKVPDEGSSVRQRAAERTANGAG